MQTIIKNGFIRNPIVVVDDQKAAYKIIELDHRPFFDFKVLKIFDMNKNLIHQAAFKSKASRKDIRLSRQLGMVEFAYYDDQDAEIDSVKKDLRYSELHDEFFDPEMERVYHAMSDVRKQMDKIEGTQLNKESHNNILSRATIDKKARDYVITKIKTIISQLNYIEKDEINDFTYQVYAQLYGLGAIQELDDDPEVGEIMINASPYPAFHCDIYYIKNQIKRKYEKTYHTEADIKSLITKLLEFEHIQYNTTEKCMIEAMRPNRDRVNIIAPSAAENYSINIRKFRNFTPTIESMKKVGTINQTIDALFDVLVKGKCNIGIGGPMGTGKTTLVNYLLTYTDPIERKVVIASVSETDIERVLKGHDIVICNVNEDKGFTFAKHMQASLRTTASRVVIPEARAGEFLYIWEANMKTRGNLFTGHALDEYGFVDVCVDMYMSGGKSANDSTDHVKDKLSQAIDVIVMMQLVGNQIRIQSISEMLTNNDGTYAGLSTLYEWMQDPEYPMSQGCYHATGNQLSGKLMQQLNKAGIPMSKLKELNRLLLEDSQRPKNFDQVLTDADENR